MAEEDQNRSEAATPYKLDEARKKGSVAKSLDINSFFILAGATTVLYFAGSSMVGQLMHAIRPAFANAHQVSFAADDIARTSIGLLTESLLVLVPLFLVLLILAVLSNFMQTGPVFSFFPLKPDLQRINPVAGFKRLFSLRMFVETAKSTLKFVVLGLVLGYGVAEVLPLLIRAQTSSPAAIGHILLPEVARLLLKLLAALAAITLLDAVYSRWEFAKRMRMSRRDITDEYKRREGDPRIKSRMRELQREAAKRAKSMSKIRDADVLITNPTHLAVAVKYDQAVLDAPVILAKGAGTLAGRMRLLAVRHGVPVIQNKPLARLLFTRLPIGQAVPPEQYDALARIMVWAMSARRMHRRGEA